MALSVYFLLAILGLSTITQATSISEYEEIAKARFPALFNDNAMKSSSTRASIPECLQTCAVGYYVGQGLLRIKDDWYAVIEARNKDLAKCASLPNQEESQKCVAEAEKKAQAARYGVLRGALGMLIAVVAFVYRFIYACIL